MEERLKALVAFMKNEYTEKEFQEIVIKAAKKLSEVGIDSNPSLSVAERIDETCKKHGIVNPEKRKFYVDFICGQTPEIGDVENLEAERRFYAKFLFFEATQMLRRIFELEPLY